MENLGRKESIENINVCRKTVKPFTNVTLNNGSELSTVDIGSKSSHQIKNNKLQGVNEKLNNHNKYFSNKTVVIDNPERSSSDIPKSVSSIQVDECSITGSDCNPIILDDPNKAQSMANKMFVHPIKKLDFLKK